jgi:glycosyltransferase involved in cell wall biosynthesis
MRVSVVITSYNYGRYVGECLDSVLAQTCQDFDVVVVDDGSTDDTARVVEPYLSNRVRYHYQANQGQAAAKNAGIDLTDGEIVAFLDADDQWERQKLERQLPLFDNPRVGVAYTGGRAVDPEGRPVTVPARRNYMTFRRGTITKWLGFENIVPFSSVAVRRSLLGEHGAFDQSLTMGIDWDLWLRLSCETEFDFTPERLFVYRLHAKQMSNNLDGRIDGSEAIFRKFLTAHPNVFTAADLRKIHFHNSCGRGDAFRGIDRRRSSSYFMKALRLRPWSTTPYAGLVRNAVARLRS